MKSLSMNRLVLGLVTLAVVVAAFPHAAHATVKEVPKMTEAEARAAARKFLDMPEETVKTTTETKVAKVNIIDNSTPGHPLKVRVHCINKDTKEVLEDVLVDADYFYTDNVEGVLFKYYKPVIADYTSAAYYGDGGFVPFRTDLDATGIVDFTVEYRTTDANASIYSWVQENGLWYNRCGAGINSHGWRHLQGQWYLLDRTTGAMKTGWVKDGSAWYYFYSNGQMASNTTMDGYTLDSNGAMVG